MAIVTGGMQRLLFNSPELELDQLRFVGWGAGQYFLAYYPFLKDVLKLEYTVCPATGDQYGNVLGVDVKPPSELLGESKDTTVVVIFAGQFFDVMHLLRDHFGGMKCIQAFEIEGVDNEGFSTLFDEIEDFWRIKPSISFSRRIETKPKCGIFVQGLASAHTPYVLAWNRLRYPGIYQCMATWEGQSPALLDECSRWLDKLILVPQPENTGHLYINAVLRSCRLGVEHLAEQGIEYAVRCRSDNLLHGSIHQILSKYFARGRNRGKIAASVGTGGWWHHLPFMISEKVMVARTEDMLKLWSRPEDKRPHDHPDFKVDKGKSFLSLRNVVPEVMLWEYYAECMGCPVDTLADSYDFMRRYVLPLEPNLSSVSLKFIPLFTIFVNRNFCATLDDWKQNFMSHDNAIEQAQAISQLDMSVSDFFQFKVG